MGAEGHRPQAGPTLVITDESKTTGTMKDRWGKGLREARQERARTKGRELNPRFMFERISARTYMVTDRRGQPLGMLTQLPGGDWTSGGESLGRDRRRAARVLEKAAAKARIRAAKEERRG